MMTKAQLTWSQRETLRRMQQYPDAVWAQKSLSVQRRTLEALERAGYVSRVEEAVGVLWVLTDAGKDVKL